jgi:hypothetical protein
LEIISAVWKKCVRGLGLMSCSVMFFRKNQYLESLSPQASPKFNQRGERALQWKLSNKMKEMEKDSCRHEDAET